MWLGGSVGSVAQVAGCQLRAARRGRIAGSLVRWGGLAPACRTQHIRPRAGDAGAGINDIVRHSSVRAAVAAFFQAAVALAQVATGCDSTHRFLGGSR